MGGTIVVGAQFGDEGKGKIVDFLAEQFYWIARFNGGANAGHTIQHGDRKLATHLLPSGALYPRRQLVLGQGMVIDPEALLTEIKLVRDLGGLQDGTVFIDRNAHVVLPEHKDIDKERNREIGTTGRGIGPAYEARVGRRGVRICDLLQPPQPYAYEMRELCALPFVQIADTSKILSEVLTRKNGARVLFEGAQGILLDVDFGTYPYVTSSHTLPQNAALSSGLPMSVFRRVIGVTKAYNTRVGNGPFPTELTDAHGDHLRKAGNEFGATTGRPRRCGWLDIPALRYAIRVSGIDALALTKLDVLSGFKEVPVCVAYRASDTLYEEMPRDVPLETVSPVYEYLPGWENFLPTRYFTDLPENAKNFVKHLEQLLGIKICIISTSPADSATIITDAKHIFDI